MSTYGIIYFVIPEHQRPVGGLNVILDHVIALNSGGFRAALLVSSPTFRYAYGYEHGSRYLIYKYSPSLVAAYQRKKSSAKLETRFTQMLKKLIKKLINPKPPEKKRNELACPGVNDLVVAPEYLAHKIGPMFHRSRKVMLVQGPSELLLAKPIESKLEQYYFATIATSVAAEKFVRRLHMPNIHSVPLAVDPSGALAFKREKRRQIAYMPRKRQDEVSTVVAILREMPALEGYHFVPIENMSRTEVENTLRHSLFFLSFSEQEGFGLPPAEAMLTGCVVIGYVGVGGAEYFDATTGIVVADGDFVGLVEAVERAVAEYASTPARLDKMRAHAAQKIATRYSSDRARSELLLAWQSILSL